MCPSLWIERSSGLRSSNWSSALVPARGQPITKMGRSGAWVRGTASESGCATLGTLRRTRQTARRRRKGTTRRTSAFTAPRIVTPIEPRQRPRTADDHRGFRLLVGLASPARGRWFETIRADQAPPGRDTARAMSQENVDKARDFIAAYNRRDFDAAVESFDPEIEWVLPAHQWSDSCRGPDEVIRFWEGIDETFEDLKLEPQEFVDAGDRVATRLRHFGRGKGSGIEINAELYHQVVTFRAGRR